MFLLRVRAGVMPGAWLRIPGFSGMCRPRSWESLVRFGGDGEVFANFRGMEV